MWMPTEHEKYGVGESAAANSQPAPAAAGAHPASSPPPGTPHPGAAAGSGVGERGSRPASRPWPGAARGRPADRAGSACGVRGGRRACVCQVGRGGRRRASPSFPFPGCGLQRLPRGEGHNRGRAERAPRNGRQARTSPRLASASRGCGAGPRARGRSGGRGRPEPRCPPRSRSWGARAGLGAPVHCNVCAALRSALPRGTGPAAAFSLRATLGPRRARRGCGRRAVERRWGGGADSPRLPGEDTAGGTGCPRPRRGERKAPGSARRSGQRRTTKDINVDG